MFFFLLKSKILLRFLIAIILISLFILSASRKKVIKNYQLIINSEYSTVPKD